MYMRVSMNKKECKVVFIFFFIIKYNVVCVYWYDMNVIFFIY